ncbi:MAG: amylo-alpha-1,6-glucosidase [Verrucomicrobia bacterium]|nr:amylo-alpha-1,6-glucosidase [Verrucomicrobiota bacterium]
MQSSLTNSSTAVLLRGDALAVFDCQGDLPGSRLDEQGLFYRETRHLSKAMLSLFGMPLILLGSAVRDDTASLEIDLTNSEGESGQGEKVPRRALHIHRSKFLWNDACHESIEIHNYGLVSVYSDLLFEFAADFADIFELRGCKRSNRGRLLEPQLGQSSVTLLYQGLDGVLRKTKLEVGGAPADVTTGQIRIPLTLTPGQGIAFTITTSFASGEGIKTLTHREAVEEWSKQTTLYADCELSTSNEQFNAWVKRSKADLRMLTAVTSEGLYPYAGVPWFSTMFGRDGIVTALECLWFLPELARGVLKFLAATQATRIEPQKDSEPGKILHETRTGEMAQLGEVPYRRYYGSADATPLFLVLAAAYFARTGDIEFMRSIWGNIQMALGWIAKFGDRDRDGFIEYVRSSSGGLVNQGWKDSGDSIFHADGRLATGPIALCEIQSYVFCAKRGISKVAEALRYQEQSHALRRDAETLRTRFNEAFWCEEIDMYVSALDHEKRQCKVRSSNAGQCMFTGIADAERVRRMTRILSSDAFFSGWGIRTVATSEARHNPMSYHNGSVWAHDNALIAYGLSGCEDKDLPCNILAGFFDASKYVALRRLPELFCGFARRPGTGPALHPQACAPQAWAAGAVFLMLQSCLGLSVHAADSTVRLTYPRLPESIRNVTIRNLCIGPNSIDLELTRNRESVTVNILRRTGNIQVCTLA